MTWERATLKDLCLKITKRDPASTGRARVRYIDIGGVDGIRHRLTEIPEIDAMGAPSRCRQVVASGDTVFSTVRPYLEKIAYVDTRLDGEFASTGFSVLRPGPRLEPKFLYYFTLSRDMFDQILPYQKGVSYPAVLDREVRSVSMPVPPLEEQHRIVVILDDHLSRLDAADASLTTGARRLAALERAALADCRDGELRPLAEVATIQGGIQKHQKRIPKDNAFPFLRVANVTARGLDLAEVHHVELFAGELDRLRLQRGDLLVVEGNGSASQIGRAATWDGSIDDCVHQNHLIRVRPSEALIPEYLEAVWNSPQSRRALTDVASSSSGLHTLSVSKLKRLSIPVPTIDRQESLILAVKEIREAKARMVSAIAGTQRRSAALRRSLLAAAFSGRLTGSSNESSEIAEMIEA
ncbi:type I restriction enzyme S subunit [Microbacterium foliorum]|uniref:restriction endonuclease subunit S n=1 Tax=Microbacterium foliorum TaxID=104336 RepID=UPI00209D08A3|nr:restriction endonuclease subunit S [Microbacterium foliorum]MCP1428524.1 type I restriction enzyme S subunit [Microbacterium foliorum]